MDSLQMSAPQLINALEASPDSHELHAWLADEAFGHPYGGTTLYEQYIQESHLINNGLYLRFIRRLAKSTTTLWRVVEKPNSFSLTITSASKKGIKYTIHDRDLAPDVNTGDVLLTRFIDMPAGPILGRAAFNLGPIDQSVIDMSSQQLSLLISSFATMALTSPDKAHAKGVHPDQPNLSPGSEYDNAPETNKPSEREHTSIPADSAERERLLDRIRKLFAMAQQSDASPHEAEIALRRCQSLMSKYGISEADLQTSEFGRAEFTKGRTVPSHVKFLAAAVAKLHDVLFVTGDAGFAEFRGFDIDVNVAKMTLEYLTDAVERALTKRKRSGDFPAGRSAAYDYRLGFSTQVYDRVENIVEQRKSEQQAMSGSGKSLTVLKMEIVNRECGQDLASAKSSGSRGARDGAAHAAGVDDGSRVSLDQQVGNSEKNLALPPR